MGGVGERVEGEKENYSIMLGLKAKKKGGVGRRGSGQKKIFGGGVGRTVQ